MTLTTGGCQCGAVRYRISGELSGSHFCHCRMCQKASGNVFAALVGASKNAVTVEGPLTIFESSSIAQRGFCAACGTPLTFGYKDAERVCVTIGSLDHPEQVPIELHWGVESQIAWLELGDDRPRKATGDDLTADQAATLADMVSHQSRDA